MFKERLKDLRENAHLSQTELAGELDIAVRTLRGYERGEITPRIDILSRIANYFRVTSDYLIGISDSPVSAQSILFVGRPNIFAERIKELRTSKKCTQAEVAKFLNMSERTYQNIEYGANKPKYENLLALAVFYEVSIDYLVGMSDNPKRR